MATAFQPESDDGNVEYKQHLLRVSDAKFQRLVTQLQYRLTQGEGECIYELGVADDGGLVGLTDTDLAATLLTLERMAAELHCCVVSVSKTQLKPERYIQEVIVREDNDTNYLDLRVAVLGSVDCAKSTMLGVLSSSKLDDGRGSARLSIFNHPHEVVTGRTSSRSLHIVGFDNQGRLINSGSERVRKRSWPDIVKQSTKVVTLVDLPGHERYLTTTMSGMFGSKPDYAMLMVAGNKGLTHMTKEHLRLCIILEVPCVVVVSKTDIAPPDVLKATLAATRKLLKLPGVKKIPLVVTSDDDLPVCIQQTKKGALTPIVKVSFKTGQGVDLLTKLLNCLQPRSNQSKLAAQPLEMSIMESFHVKGIGTVVHGFLMTGRVAVGQFVIIGPTSTGEYMTTKVKSMHCKRVLVQDASAGKHVCLNITLERNKIKRGMVVLDKDNRRRSIWQFDAELYIFKTHHTTIKVGYEPVLHIDEIRQTAKIIAMTPDVVRAGQKAQVTMRFKVRPVFIRKGSQFVLREDKTRGMGTVTELKIEH